MANDKPRLKNDMLQNNRPSATGMRDYSSVSEQKNSTTHIIIIPSYNSGCLLAETVAAARLVWAPILVVIDGSTDGSASAVDAMAQADAKILISRLPENQGKGGAVHHGLIIAQMNGFTHALIMDADGQHPADTIPVFMSMSANAPEAVVMGRPQFGPDAPLVRVIFRRLSNACAVSVTLRRTGDSLFGFRVYPIKSLLAVMRATKSMRRFDFDPEAVVRLAWTGSPLIHVPVPVRYLNRAEHGVSHFNYVRDNLLLARMYLRLGGIAFIRALRTLWKPVSF